MMMTTAEVPNQAHKNMMKMTMMTAAKTKMIKTTKTMKMMKMTSMTMMIAAETKDDEVKKMINQAKKMTSWTSMMKLTFR